MNVYESTQVKCRGSVSISVQGADERYFVGGQLQTRQTNMQNEWNQECPFTFTLRAAGQTHGEASMCLYGFIHFF